MNQTPYINQPPPLIDRIVLFVRRFPVSSTCIVLSIFISLPIILEGSFKIKIPLVYDFIYYQLRIAASLYKSGLPELQRGQIYRLITPIFLHFSVMHIVFNMVAMYFLGAVIEFKQKRWFYIVLILVLAVFSNILQYFVDGPRFGGMSGVIYGFFGYIWMQQKFNPRFGLFLEKQVIIMVVAWYVLCFTGLVGPVANTAHTVGLLSGIFFGVLVAFVPQKHVLFK
ncbi:MAG: rhomboid family intramembrane serine protease [Gammaproteobacteria bacterium]|nr:MAG: rhomboid family intramembrane serine protease [Gammaproteobacteria bacterium]